MENFFKVKSGAGSSESSSKTLKAKQSSAGPSTSFVPWVEKYRPRTVSDIAQQEEVVAVLKKVLQGADLPNLLFYGPPGTGKTSMILAMGRELFGDIYKSRILELNASDERGIQVVREKVKNFAQLTASSTRPDGRPCPPLKIVILDEADSMTSGAQACLRRIMEKESKTTRFCLICNYVSRIIEPLTSRCSKFRFKQLNHDILVARLKDISEKESVLCQDQALEVIIATSNGDLRKAITTLQSVYRLKGSKEITTEDVCEIAGVVPECLLDKLFDICRSRGSYAQMENYVQSLIVEGYAANQIFIQLTERIISNDTLTDKAKCSICECLAICDHRLIEGADEYLQLMVVCGTLLQELQASR